MKLPVIATKWGGPLDYLDDDCGILIEPNSPDTFVNQLAQSIIKLSKSPELRQIIGEKGHQKVINEFDWQKKAERMIEIYQSTILQSQRS
jgi:glycosyltransferase involved in cell wall biosynthesis